jgi:CHRD domain
VFFCSNLGNAPAGTPTCPLNSGTVTGTWTKASVLGIAGQNVNAGDFDALTDALTSNTAYANIHQTALPAGEIRGQIHSREEEEEHQRQR